METMDYSIKIPVTYEVDIFVAGGGSAGIAAAVTASRQGSKVFLAEMHTCFGGMGTAGRVPAFCKFSDGMNFLAGGIGREVYDKCWEYGAVGPDDADETGKTMHHICIRAEVLKRIYDDMVADSGAEFSFLTKVIGVEKDRDKVSYAICSSKSGIFAVKARCYIDCTGDGDMAAMAGASFEKGDEEGNMQSGTLCSLWSGIDWKKVKEAGFHNVWPDNSKAIHQAWLDKVLTYDDSIPGMWVVGNKTGAGNIGHTFGVDGTDEKSYTKALLWGRKSMVEYELYYKQYLKGFEAMELAATGDLLGIRETRRITGEYILNMDDYMGRAVFQDEIGRYNYEIDIHPSRADKKHAQELFKQFEELRYSEGESYGIPYRTLLPLNVSNVLTAGRCISTDRRMHASVRAMPGCFITGQASGMAAAMACERNTDVRGIAVKELQERLKKMGAYLPNC